MSGFYKKMKETWNSIKEALVPGRRGMDAHDELCSRFSQSKAISADELGYIEGLCRSVCEPQCGKRIEDGFRILREIASERDRRQRVEEKSEEELRRGKRRREHVDTEGGEEGDSEGERRKAKRQRRKGYQRKYALRKDNDVSWGVLPRKYRGEGRTPGEVLERAVSHEGMEDNLFLQLGEVSSDEEEEYFSESNVNRLNSEDSVQVGAIRCNFGGEYNCRDCIEYEIRKEYEGRESSMREKTEERKRIRRRVARERWESRMPRSYFYLEKDMGLDRAIARYITDENFDADDLSSEERERLGQILEQSKEKQLFDIDRIGHERSVKFDEDRNEESPIPIVRSVSRVEEEKAEDGLKTVDLGPEVRKSEERAEEQPSSVSLPSEVAEETGDLGTHVGPVLQPLGQDEIESREVPQVGEMPATTGNTVGDGGLVDNRPFSFPASSQGTGSNPFAQQDGGASGGKPFVFGGTSTDNGTGVYPSPSADSGQLLNETVGGSGGLGGETSGLPNTSLFKRKLDGDVGAVPRNIPSTGNGPARFNFLDQPVSLHSNLSSYGMNGTASTPFSFGGQQNPNLPFGNTMAAAPQPPLSNTSLFGATGSPLFPGVSGNEQVYPVYPNTPQRFGFTEAPANVLGGQNTGSVQFGTGKSLFSDLFSGEDNVSQQARPSISYNVPKESGQENSSGIFGGSIFSTADEDPFERTGRSSKRR